MSVFRPAFVELGRAAFEEMKALGEAFEEAIVEAAKPVPAPVAPVPTPVSEMLRALDHNVIRNLCERFDWSGYSVYMMPDRCKTVVHVVRPCGHPYNVALDDEGVFLRAEGLRERVDAYVWQLEAAAEKHRICRRCVRQMALGPAGRTS